MTPVAVDPVWWPMTPPDDAPARGSDPRALLLLAAPARAPGGAREHDTDGHDRDEAIGAVHVSLRQATVWLDVRTRARPVQVPVPKEMARGVPSRESRKPKALMERAGVTPATARHRPGRFVHSSVMADSEAIRRLGDQVFSRTAGAPLVRGNAVRLLRDAAENYPAWLDAIRAARRSVHFENYIVHDDDVGQRFAAAFLEKAREGVPVRVVYDWFGSLGKASAGFWRRLREGGVDVRCYNPPRLDQPLGWIGRDHRKCLVVDGQVAFVTGLCVGRMWEGAPERGLPGVARHRGRGSRPRGGRGGPRLRRHLGGHGRAPASRRDRRPGAPRGGRPGPARRGVDTGHRRALPPRSPGGLARPPHAVAHRRLLRGHVRPTCRRCARRRRTAST